MDDVDKNWISTLAGFPKDDTINAEKIDKTGHADSQRTRLFISQLKDIQSRQESSPDRRIADAISQLIRILHTSEFAIAFKNSSDHIWSRKSILKHIAKIVDPPLAEIFPPGSLAWTRLYLKDTGMPLVDHLNSPEKLQSLTENLRGAAEFIEQNFDPGIDDWEIMEWKGNSLVAVAEIIDLVRTFLPDDPLIWCNACFRRTRLKYCTLHKPSRSKNGIDSYRKARRLKASLSDEVLKKWRDYQCERNVLHESFDVLCVGGSAPESFAGTYKAIFVTEEVKSLVDKTLKDSWSIVSPAWEDVFTLRFPKLSVALQRRPTEFQSWNEFAIHIRSLLKDSEEKTTHPFWVLTILTFAERWQEAEGKFKDKRKTDTATTIATLFESGITNPRELAQRTEKSIQYIYRQIRAVKSRKNR